ncbi:MAG: hypothetical protein V8Q17_06800 [Acutalibacteraceae bacterium]
MTVLMLCGGQGLLQETEFTSKWMGLKYTLPDDMVMMTEEYLESLAASGKCTGME